MRAAVLCQTENYLQKSCASNSEQQSVARVMSRRMEWFYCISLNYISEVQHKKLKYFLGQNLVSFINSPQQTS